MQMQLNSWSRYLAKIAVRTIRSVFSWNRTNLQLSLSIGRARSAGANQIADRRTGAYYYIQEERACIITKTLNMHKSDSLHSIFINNETSNWNK